MAHWIIRDEGFGGSYYTCSNCGESLHDIFDKNAGGEKCPQCGAIMDEDYDEYIEEKTALDKLKDAMKKLDGIPPIRINCSYEYARDEQNVHKLEQVSGRSIEELIELFAAGWTLRPHTKFDDLLSMMGLED